MSQHLNTPEGMQPLGQEETFTFSCHSSLACFTECCRMLDLALTPYDVLRLRRGTGLTSTQLLEQYIIEEQEVAEPFPRYYLTMVDDGRASCVFVSPQGCTVYPHRPSPCRAYPLARGIRRISSNHHQEHHVIIKEPHCLGFSESVEQNVERYSRDQQLNEYNRMNDKMTDILQHEAIRQGFIPSEKQIAFFRLALYDLDRFRDHLAAGKFLDVPGAPENQVELEDEDLLLAGMKMVQNLLFSTF